MKTFLLRNLEGFSDDEMSRRAYDVFIKGESIHIHSSQLDDWLEAMQITTTTSNVYIEKSARLLFHLVHIMRGFN